MKFRLMTALGVLMLVGSPFAAGGAQTVGYHNVHLRVADPAKAIEWYTKVLGATIPPPPYSVAFGKTVIAFVKTDTLQPSAGSVIDHIGLSYADLDAKMKDFQAGGAKIVSPVRDVQGLFKLAFIEDPWGVKIEVVQDPEQLGFHHVHLRVKEPEVTLTWYQDMLGGDRAKLKGRIDGLRYGGVWLLAAASGNETTVPSADRAIMNTAFQVANVDEATAALKRKQVKTVVEPRSVGNGNTLRYAFFDDPNGARFELVQP